MSQSPPNKFGSDRRVIGVSAGASHRVRRQELPNLPTFTSVHVTDLCMLLLSSSRTLLLRACTFCLQLKPLRRVSAVPLMSSATTFA